MTSIQLKHDFTWTELDILLRILDKVHNKERLSIGEIVKKVETSPYNPIFYRIMRYLEEEDILICIDKIGPTKFMKIDSAKLKELIFEQEIIDKVRHFFNTQNFGVTL